MTDTDATRHESLIARAKGILLRPREEWLTVLTEPRGIAEIVTGYVLPLAAIGPVAALIGGQVFGYSVFGINYRPPLIAGISASIASFVLTLVSLFVMTLIVEFLAPRFGGVTTRVTTFKLTAYSMTASWLAAIFAIIPALAWLGIVGFYSFYIFYTGVVPLVNVPAAKALTFTIVTVICAILLSLICGFIATQVAGLLAAPASLGNAGAVSGSVAVPGIGTIDVARMQQAAKKAEAAANGVTKAADAAALQALLPAAIAGFSRTSVES